MKQVILFFVLILSSSFWGYSQPRLELSGSVEWDTMSLKSEISLDLASMGLRLPAGRTQAEFLLRSSFLNMIMPHLLQLQVDSSSTVGDLVNRGELNLQDIERIVLGARVTPPFHSSDMRLLSASHLIQLSNVSSALIRHNRPAPVIRTLAPVSAARYTGIVIIANESLPLHGMRSSALPIPCLFPKIWDSDMNLIYERNMFSPSSQSSAIVRYSSPQGIFHNNPSGLSPELQQIVGERPLRIFARGVFGIKPTDLIIDRNDALLIIASEENRRLLSQGRVAIILDESVLRYEFDKD
jgi:hypothetical protein